MRKFRFLITVLLIIFFLYSYPHSSSKQKYRYLCKKLTHPTFGYEYKKCKGFKYEN